MSLIHLFGSTMHSKHGECLMLLASLAFFVVLGDGFSASLFFNLIVTQKVFPTHKPKDRTNT